MGKDNGASVFGAIELMSSPVPRPLLPSLPHEHQAEVDAAAVAQHDGCVDADAARLTRAEYLNYEGTKFSKSRGVGVFGENARDTGVPPSVWRYFLLATRPETADSDFTWNGFIARNNGELLNNLGNFVNRVLKFLNAKCDSTVPTPDASRGSDATYLSGPAEQALKRDVDALLATYVADMDALRIRSGLETVMRISARGNLYLAEEDVGVDLLKRDPARFATVLLTATNLIYALTALVHPFMPATAAAIERQLNAPERCVPDQFRIDLFPGHRIGQAEHLFKRIDPANEQIWRERYGGAAAAQPDPASSAKQSKKAAAKAKQKAKAEVPPPGESTAPKPREVVEAEACVVRGYEDGLMSPAPSRPRASRSASSRRRSRPRRRQPSRRCSRSKTTSPS